MNLQTIKKKHAADWYVQQSRNCKLRNGNSNFGDTICPANAAFQ